jgi:hypothetical protein
MAIAIFSLMINNLSAQESLPFENTWATDLSGWQTVSLKGSSEWAWKSEGTLQIGDGKKEQNDWLISPAINLSSENSKELFFKAGWKDAKSSNLSVYYSTNYNEGGTKADINNADWTVIEEDIIKMDDAADPDSPDYDPATAQAPGYSSTAIRTCKYTITEKANKVYFAFKYAKVGDPEGSQNQVRVKSLKVTENKPTSISKVKSLKLYPNPATDYIQLETSNNIEVYIYSLSGQLVMQKNNSTNRIDISSLTSGQYLIKTIDENKTTVNQFIKK